MTAVKQQTQVKTFEGFDMQNFVMVRLLSLI